MSKLLELDNRKGYYLFNCPACKVDHYVNTNPEFGTAWTFNGDVDSPTVSPSLLIGSIDKGVRRCHSFIREGKIQFLSDCEHELANKTVELPDYTF